jgi:hypothetical protein
MGMIRVNLDDEAHGDLLKASKLMRKRISDVTKIAIHRGLPALMREAERNASSNGHE